jgi:hypothetical protein
MKKFLFLTIGFLVFVLATLLADPEVELELGINYFLAGRKDLAKDAFTKILQQNLKTEERAAVLYDLATTLLQEGALSDAKKIFDQLEYMPIQSQILKESIQKNQVICTLELIKRELHSPQQTSDTGMAYEIETQISKLEKMLPKYKQLPFYEALVDELGKLNLQFDNFKFLQKLAGKSMSDELLIMIGYLYRKQRELLSYLSASQDITAYVVALSGDILPKLQLIAFSSPQDEVGSFIQDLITHEKEKLAFSFAHKNGQDAYRSLVRLTSAYSLFRGYLAGRDIQELLEQRVDALGYEQLNEAFLTKFWQTEKKEKDTLLVTLLEKKAKQCSIQAHASKDVDVRAAHLLQKELLETFQKHILNEKNFQDVLQDELYYDILQQDEIKTFKALLELNLAKDDALISLDALVDRLLAEAKLSNKKIFSQAAQYVQDAKASLQKNDISAFQTMIIQAFALVNPKTSLLYQLKKLEKSQDIQKDKDVFILSFEAAKSYLSPDLRQRIEAILLLFNQKDTPYTELCLQAIEFELLYRDQISEHEFLDALHFGIQYEKNILKQNQVISDVFEEITAQYVENLEKQVNRLQISKEDKKELQKDFQEVKKIIRDQNGASRQVVEEKREHTLVLQLLEKIERMLQKQKEEQKQTQNQKPAMIQQINQNDLLLTPEESIRYLQEMEAIDKSTEQKPQQVQEVERPW